MNARQRHCMQLCYREHKNMTKSSINWTQKCVYTYERRIFTDRGMIQRLQQETEKMREQEVESEPWQQLRHAERLEAWEQYRRDEQDKARQRFYLHLVSQDFPPGGVFFPF